MPTGASAPYAPPLQPSAYVAPWAPPPAGQFSGALLAPAPPRSAALGRFALISSLFAAIVVPVLMAAGFAPIAPLLVNQVNAGNDPFADLGWLHPVAGWELLAELSFYAGTIAGIVAIVAGLVAAIGGRGRVAGIWAIVVGALAPLVVAAVMFVILVTAATTTGAGSTV